MSHPNPPSGASAQDVRDAAVSAVRLARASLIISTLIALVSTYLSIAGQSHWWPWRQNSALGEAMKVSTYDNTRFGIDAAGNVTEHVNISIANNSPDPARSVLLYLSAGPSVFHADLDGSVPVILSDLLPCHLETYAVVIDFGKSPTSTLQPEPFKVQYSLNSDTWELPIGMSGRPYQAAITNGEVYPAGDPAGLSGLKGFTAETVGQTDSHGPGCG